MSMRHSTSLLGLCIAIAAVGLPSLAAAQAQARDAGQWVVPRTPEGHPDLQGNWSNATITPLTRREGQSAVLTWDEVATLEGRAAGRLDRLSQPSDPDRAPPEIGGRVGGSDGLGGDLSYNGVYLDRGDRVAVVNGEPRSSLLTNPPDGRRPARTPEAIERAAERRASRPQFGPYDNPENRPLAERCIVSFGSNAGPPMLPNGFYNNNYTIVQTADYVMIHTEMVHDTRIIRLGEPDPLPEGVRPWFGDSWGRWEGDALVVETTNLNLQQSYSSPGAKVIERFTRADEETLLYEFTIDDPSYTQPWGGQVPFRRLDQLVYEYSCHEGNYALTNILSGARYQEAQGARNGPEQEDRR